LTEYTRQVCIKMCRSIWNNCF